MTRPKILDLFCCAGGAAAGYAAAGFDVVGVDIAPQPNYPFEFIEGDALDVLRRMLDGLPVGGYALSDFAAIHASPPCPLYSRVTGFHPSARATHPDLVAPSRELLAGTGLPWVMENVPGSPLRRDLVLCGEMFGLRVHRHRWFETGGFLAMQPPHSRHRLRGARTNCHIEQGFTRWVTGNFADLADAGDAMGIGWMTRGELAQAIPPAYTEFIGRQLVEHLAVRSEGQETRA